MKKVKSIFMKPTILLGIAAVLLLGSGVGSARAALTYYSDQYSGYVYNWSFFKGKWKDRHFNPP